MHSCLIDSGLSAYPQRGFGGMGRGEASESYLAIAIENNTRVLQGKLVVAQLVKFAEFTEPEDL